MKWRYQLLMVSLAGGLIWSASHYQNKYQAEKLRADSAEREVESQGQVIASQSFNFARFNLAAEYTGNLNSIIGAGSEKTIIEYREILLSEKNCDLFVPDNVAGGLLSYAHRIRASAMYADTGNADATSNRSATSSRLTYCEAVLWINPLLAAIEKANNQLSAIREIEQERK